MDAGFPLFDVGSLAPAGNWVSNQFLQDIELSLAYGYASPSAPAPLGGTGSEPDERAAVCTDSSTVGHEYPGGVKISHAIMVECAETCYFWCEDDVPFAKKTTYQCVVCKTPIRDSRYNLKRHCQTAWEGLDEAEKIRILSTCQRRCCGGCQRKWELMWQGMQEGSFQDRVAACGREASDERL